MSSGSEHETLGLKRKSPSSSDNERLKQTETVFDINPLDEELTINNDNNEFNDCIDLSKIFQSLKLCNV